MVRYFEDFRVGDVYELGLRRVSEREIVDFATAFDPQPRHTDTGRGVIASGWHVAGIFMRLYVDAVLGDTAADVSPGVERLHWLGPVHPNTLLFGQVSVLEVQPSMSRPDRGIVHQRGELVDRGGEPVFRIRFYGIIERSPGVESPP